MANYTPNYGLHQWEPGDNFLRTDFNQDFAKIDTAIKALETATDAKVEGGDVQPTRQSYGTACRHRMTSLSPWPKPARQS